jgi:hypothetical protein
MTHVYVVNYETGEYQDTRQSVHAAFFSKAKADRECERMNQILLNAKRHYNDNSGCSLKYSENGLAEVPDIDYNGGDFSIQVIEVQD